jgi:TorA maturation chaperone TorD
VAALLAAPAEESAAVVGEAAATHDWLADAAKDLAALPLTEWQAEHARLFVSGHPRTACPPFASAWLDGITPGPTTVAAAALFACVGLAAEEMPADYLGTLLQCAAWACGQESEQARTLERELWERYLRPWLPRFAKTLGEESGVALYCALAQQLAAFCEEPHRA